MVFDSEFSTVPSVGKEEPVPYFWNELDLDHHTKTIRLDNFMRDMDHILNADWFTSPNN